MGFLRRVLGGGGQQGAGTAGPTLVVDDFLGDEAVRSLAAGIDADDGAAFRAYLAAEPDLERRDFAIEATVRDGKAHGPWIDRWVAEEPESALAHLVQGRDLTAWAWVARTRRDAKYVSDEQAREFFARLDLAWQALERASRLDDGDGSAFAFLIDCAKGVGLEIETRVNLFAEAQARRPWQRIAHSALIQAIAPKWSGPEGAMFEFAARTTAEAPVGSVVHVVVPEAHFEGSLAQGRSYWRDPAVRTAIADAAARSIDSPAFGPTPWAPTIRNAFGYCFWKLGERERAREQFDLAGPVVAGPFLSFTDAVAEAKRARREVGAAIQG